MTYRTQKTLPAIPLSKSLTRVAQLHVRDLMENHPDAGDCNIHSWSEKGSWRPCCYYADHRNAALMWGKPGELTAYPGKGFEIGFRSSGGAAAAEAMRGLRSSKRHNAVMLNREVWGNIFWASIGLAIYGEYSVVWFGTELDPAGGAPVCQGG